VHRTVHLQNDIVEFQTLTRQLSAEHITSGIGAAAASKIALAASPVAAAQTLGLPPSSSLMAFPLHIQSPAAPAAPAAVPAALPPSLGLEAAVQLPPSIALSFGTQLPGAPIAPDFGPSSLGATWAAQQPHTLGAPQPPLQATSMNFGMPRETMSMHHHANIGLVSHATTTSEALLAGGSMAPAFLGAQSPGLQQTMREADLALQAAAMASNHHDASTMEAPLWRHN
jgi:hypothetical protein